MYEGKTSGYFGHVRKEILPLFPKGCHRLLEIGSGSGETLSYLKELGLCQWTCGVERFPEAAKRARRKVDLVIEGDIEVLDLPLAEESIDVILCLDVLEHLVDPWKTVSRLKVLLRPSGVFIASIPNVRNFRVSLPLIFFGEWEYTGEGLLDKTHLRFFTRKTALEMFEMVCLEVDSVLTTWLEKGSKARIVNALTLSMFRPLFELQYLIRARKT